MIKMPKTTEKFLKIARTSVLYFAFIALGVCLAVPGPTLMDLQHAVNTDTKHIALIYSSRSTGFLLGSLLGGIMFDFFKHKQILLILCNFFMCLSAVATPWCTSLGALIAAMVGGGLAMGALDTGGNVWLLNIWGKKSAPFLQALHFAYGFGGFIGPLIAAPFLAEQAVDNRDNSSESHLHDGFSSTYNPMLNFSAHENLEGGLTTYLQPTQYFNETDSTYANTDIASASNSLKWIYSIVGGVSFLSTFLFVLLYFLTTKDENYSEEKTDENIKAPGKVFTFIVAILVCILTFTYAGIEIGYAQMLVMYAVKGNLKLSKSTGSFMTSMFWGTFTFSRGLGILLSLYFSSLTIMIADLVLTVASGIILLVFSTSSETYLWVGTATLGVALASFYPSAISFIERYIVITNKVASMFCVGGSLGEMVIPLLISQFIESFPEVLFYAVELSGILCCFTLFILWLLVKRRGKKYVSDVKTGKDNETFEVDKF